MDNTDRKTHWENVYQKKAVDEVSWYQPTPETSLDFIKKSRLPKTAKIIDVGGGDSFLVNHLLEMGYQNISVLDISPEAIKRAKKRLGARAGDVQWIVADIIDFYPAEAYDLWHDRATFHFLTEEKDISRYLEIAKNNIRSSGHLVIGTFSEKGPEKCSGLPITQYSEQSMSDLLKPWFRKTECRLSDHETPSGSIQNFIFCGFRPV